MTITGSSRVSKSIPSPLGSLFVREAFRDGTLPMLPDKSRYCWFLCCSRSAISFSSYKLTSLLKVKASKTYRIQVNGHVHRWLSHGCTSYLYKTKHFVRFTIEQICWIRLSPRFFESSLSFWQNVIIDRVETFDHE